MIDQEKISQFQELIEILSAQTKKFDQKIAYNAHMQLAVALWQEHSGWEKKDFMESASYVWDIEETVIRTVEFPDENR